MRTFQLAAFCGAVAVAAVAAPLAADRGAMAMLAGLQKGRWTITSTDGGPSKAICLGNPAALIQLRHPTGACTRFVVEDSADNVTVQYTCKGRGFGRTSIRRETSGLVQIESQGTDGGRPFQFRAEARRTGACK